MKISGRYSHNDGETFINETNPQLLRELEETISLINAESCRLQSPSKRDMKRAARLGITQFISPTHISAVIQWHLFKLGWGLRPRITIRGLTQKCYREIRAVKDELGVEVQFGRYPQLIYDITTKMVVFKNLGVIHSGVEICLTASMLPQMLSGIGTYEQVVWDLATRGAADIDIPVLVLGIESNEFYEATQ